ncbi:MAG: DNA-deoxyinosine glycosylase [Gammaproteobacteria bacterium]|nr:DNA-deoxyinosine glycosylase [Gammaproteobacteria bacterium]
MSNSLADLLTGFDCVADVHSEILILGSMPGIASLQQQQYYAHPRNAFWPIMQALYGIAADLPYSERLMQLKKHKIALWDVAHQCVREGSLDSNIQAASVQLNDFYSLFAASQRIKRLCFNGAKAAALFNKGVLQSGNETVKNMQYLQLPSTSPANARLTLDQKIALWRQILD